MSDAEAIMWAVEKDPALRSDFTNISILERAPDAARVRAKVEQAIEAIPRLGDRVVAVCGVLAVLHRQERADNCSPERRDDAETQPAKVVAEHQRKGCSDSECEADYEPRPAESAAAQVLAHASHAHHRTV